MADQARLDEVVDEVARITGRNVTLDDVFSKVLAYNTSHPTTDRARIESVLMKAVTAEARTWESGVDLASRSRPFVLPGDPEKGFLDRVCIPLVSRGFRVGYLWILVRDENDPPGPILEAVLSLGSRIEEFASTVLEAVEPVTQETAARERDLLAVLSGDTAGAPEWLQRALGQRRSRVAVLSHPDLYRPGQGQGGVRMLRQGAAEALRAVQSPVVWAACPRHVVFVVTDVFTGVDLSAVRRRLALSLALHGLGADADSTSVEVGLSGWAESADRLGEQYAQAVAALQTRAVDPRLPEVLEYGACGVYQFLARNGAEPSSSRLQVISAAPNGEELLATLEQIYDSDGTRAELADALHIHRTSLYHRLRRVGSILAEDALGSAVRLDLHLALKARRWQERPRFALGDDAGAH